MNQSIHTFHDSPLGRLRLESIDHCLTALWLPQGRHVPSPDPTGKRDDAAFDPVRRQLDAYFAGRRRTFEVEMRGVGTVFQQSVWAALQEIPYGETWSYGQLAARLGRPGASRAVGAANGRNPLSILVPCHRVVGADGSLTGYGGGLPAKRWLLELERTGAPPVFGGE